jgi:UPF0716 protein FxsA
MGLFLLALFILWALAELAALSAVAGAVGILDALAILLLISVAGAFLTKRAGFGAARRVRRAQAEGRLPSNELIDGLLIFVAGVLLVVPGFVSGALGLLLLLPPVRIGTRLLVVRRFRGYGEMVVVRTRDGRRTGASEVLDAESWEDPPEAPGQSEIEAPR